jgi:hypothetical protein
MEIELERTTRNSGVEMSISNGSYLVDNDDASQSQTTIAGKETDGVLRWRFAVAIMLLITASTVITTTYKFLTRAEDDEFLSGVC